MASIQTSGEQWLSLFLAVAALHGLWLAVLLIAKARKQAGAGLLGLAFVFLSLYLGNYLLFLSGAIRSVPHLLGVFYPLMFLIGPSYYFFVRRSLQTGLAFGRRQLWHLLPFVWGVWKTVPLYLAEKEYKLRLIDWFLLPEPGQYTWQMILVGNDFLYVLLAYVLGAWSFARRHDGRQARWLRNFSMGFAGLILLDLGLKFVLFFLKWPAPQFEYLMAGLLTVGIHLAAYYAFDLQILPGVSTRAEQGKYRTSPLTAGKMEEVGQALLELMERERPYLDPELRIADLATRLQLPPHYLSQVLSESLGLNFYDFVNRYRVEAVKQKLGDERYRHYSILAIGLECGFANKTTFNRTFKKMTGHTPSGFLEKAGNA